ncbi:hypothetical protein [Tumebacillus flagellatus]|uniref:Uncharacterized protein n=1 Tax=Tumebacillus flagellatus TaxID=1157490 RepID=A0A074LL56_9BACL|nr:hypothetical protein [Tumebacillus flagellatus]KEO81290.1 hypothetical protein EL26_21675 [Tumebacillus flagellatus]
MSVRRIIRRPLEFNLDTERDNLANEYCKRLKNVSGFLKDFMAEQERQLRAKHAMQQSVQHGTAQHSAAQRHSGQ